MLTRYNQVATCMIQMISTVMVQRREKTMGQKIRDSLIEEERLKLELKECKRFRWKREVGRA